MTSVIEVSHLSRHFGSFKAVSDVSFEVERGEIFGYLGANGAGKSTTIRMLTGLLVPTFGEARVAGCDVASDAEGLKASIGYMSQKFSLYLDLPVIENLSFFGGAYGLSPRAVRKRAKEVLALTGLSGLENVHTGSLPGGTRQRLALSSALLHEPDIVFLDEPTAGVDPEARRNFWRIIKDLSDVGTTIFVTTHYLDEAEYCARIGLMVDGRLVALDTPAALKREFVKGQIYSVRGQRLREASRTIETKPGVIAIAPFGAGMHFRLDEATWTESLLRDALVAAGASQLVLERGEPTLEDVFLEVVGPGRTPLEAE